MEEKKYSENNEKENNKNDKKGKNKKSPVKKIIMIVLLLVIAVCVFVIIKTKRDEALDVQKQMEVSQVIDTIEVPEEEITPEITERMLKIAELKKENPDVVGWIEIEGTSIKYPVLQGEDNDYYLRHNYKKEYVAGGSIFLDKAYDFSKPSSNLLIYGHRHEQGIMFEDLIKYKDESFYKEHKTIRFTTIDEDATYEIIAAFNSRVYYKDETGVFRYYFFVDAETEDEYNEYVSQSKAASLYDTGLSASYGEQLMTLSTCDYRVENGRFAVVAKKVVTE